jgi:hypothetical protein
MIESLASGDSQVRASEGTMESEEKSQKQESREGESKSYEPPAVVASYTVDELRRAAAVSAVSIA